MINAQLVLKLRDETQYPMMECKRALVYCKGDFKKAKEFLRKPVSLQSQVDQLVEHMNHLENLINNFVVNSVK